VGPNTRGDYEVYVAVAAATQVEAETAAGHFMNAVLSEAQVFALELTALK